MNAADEWNTYDGLSKTLPNEPRPVLLCRARDRNRLHTVTALVVDERAEWRDAGTCKHVAFADLGDRWAYINKPRSAIMDYFLSGILVPSYLMFDMARGDAKELSSAYGTGAPPLLEDGDNIIPDVENLCRTADILGEALKLQWDAQDLVRDLVRAARHRHGLRDGARPFDVEGRFQEAFASSYPDSFSDFPEIVSRANSAEISRLAGYIHLHLLSYVNGVAATLAPTEMHNYTHTLAQAWLAVHQCYRYAHLLDGKHAEYLLHRKGIAEMLGSLLYGTETIGKLFGERCPEKDHAPCRECKEYLEGLRGLLVGIFKEAGDTTWTNL